MVRFPASIAGGPGSIPGRGNKILQAMQRGQEEKKKVAIDTEYLDSMRTSGGTVAHTCQGSVHGFNPWPEKILHASEQLSLRATTTPSSRACEPQLVKSKSLEPVLHGKKPP